MKHEICYVNTLQKCCSGLTKKEAVMFEKGHGQGYTETTFLLARNFKTQRQKNIQGWRLKVDFNW